MRAAIINVILQQVLLALLLHRVAGAGQAQVDYHLNISIAEPPDPDINEGNDREGIVLVEQSYMLVNASAEGTAPSGNITFAIDDDIIALAHPLLVQWRASNASADFVLNVTGLRLGWTKLNAKFHPDVPSQDSIKLVTSQWRVTVLRVQTLAQQIYRIFIISMIVLISFGMGCSIEIPIVIGHLKRPLPLLIGLAMQYLLMPHLALGLGQLLVAALTNQQEADTILALAFGLLTMGCSPGGGSSNSWTLLLGGDLNLSISMTFFSQICALFMMPLWLLAYARLYVNTSEVRIPYETIVINLMQLVIPLLIGLLVKYKLETLAKKVTRYLRPFVVMFLIIVLIGGFIINSFLYELIARNPGVIPFAAMLPWLGFVLAFTIAKLLRLQKTQALAVGLECGFQNASIPILLLQFSMPEPDGDIATIVPLIVVLLTPLPLYIWLLVTRLRQRFCTKAYEIKTDYQQQQQPKAEEAPA